jgi:rRNA maturation protein Nop10
MKKAPLLHRMARMAAYCESIHDAPDEAQALRDGINEIKRLRAYFETACPCCGGETVCAHDCTFSVDCPNDHEKMAHFREILAEAA